MKRNAFTLIELLVVVAIITALLAILLPSMGRAVEVAHRAVCASQLHQSGLGLISYATDRLGAMPPGNATLSPFVGLDSTYYVAGNIKYGLAYLITEGYITEPDVFYCPSWRHPHMQVGKVNTVTDGYGFPPGTMGGWPIERQTGPTYHRGTSYYYRSTFGPAANTPPRINQAGKSNPTLLADHWTRREGLVGVLYGHVEGYTIARMDSSTDWTDIDADEMEDLQPTGETNTAWAWQEVFVRDWFD